MLSIFFFSACHDGHPALVDELNERSYDFHYRSLDSTQAYAERALQLSEGYVDGRAEAFNNLAFYYIARMDYNRAYQLLDSVKTDNLVELLVADVQYMRLCQRESKNKLFYDYRERALRNLRRIDAEQDRLSPHQRRRFIYAKSEFNIVQSTYFYYVGLTEESVAALARIEQNGGVEQDTAQLLNYLYNVGSGGIVSAPTTYEIASEEFDLLARCYQLAVAEGYPFFEAQALQAMSEHLESVSFRHRFVRERVPLLALINPDEMPDTLLAGYLAQRALDIFSSYGDVYQTAGAYRTLAECFWGIGDYQSAEICLLNALNRDTVINRAPDLVASIREQLSLVYSAIDDKKRSDMNRNIYLDMQEQTRQDRQLEARRDQLQQTARQLNIMTVAVVVMIVIVLLLLYLFHSIRRRSDQQFSTVSLLEPLEKWKQETTSRTHLQEEHDEEIREQIALTTQQMQQNKRRNLEQRAKVSLVNSITPFIDRIKNEVNRLMQHNETNKIRAERYSYINELTEKINDYNDVLTRWIEMRQGEVSLHVESFPLQELFDIVRRGRMSFQMKGVELQVDDTTNWVKADKTLTLFMINTMADNARKFTPRGGHVVVRSHAEDDCIEVSVSDTGTGLTSEQLASVFQTAVRRESSSGGFGLMNCKGIIEKYRKISKIFSVCSIGAESEPGKGSRFFFRLPKGMVRLLLLLLSLVPMAQPVQADLLSKASAYADSAYFCNIDGRFRQTLTYADSCRQCLNGYYLSQHPDGVTMMRAYEENTDLPADLQWFRDGLPTDFDVILSIRNEVAVAALALHDWSLYQYNNKVYTMLFRELSADKTLASYCRDMQRSENNNTVAVILLILLLLSIFPAYYLLYYQHRLAYRYQVERVNSINRVLLSEATADEKLERIGRLWNRHAKTADRDYLELEKVVSQVSEALRQDMIAENNRSVSIELAEDELHRVSFERDRLYISNSVLDNCLSALKHETMYYPSRIRQLVAESAPDLSAISELVSYYKDLYSMLSMQAMRQIESPVRIDDDLLAYLFEILGKHGGGTPVAEPIPSSPPYLRVTVPMPSLNLSDEQLSHLFTPLTSDVDYLLCRQIVRELAEATNAHGCGIEAVRSADAGIPVNIVIILTQQIWSHLK